MLTFVDAGTIPPTDGAIAHFPYERTPIFTPIKVNIFEMFNNCVFLKVPPTPIKWARDVNRTTPKIDVPELEDERFIIGWTVIARSGAHDRL
jgi:hypothetical protein